MTVKILSPIQVFKTFGSLASGDAFFKVLGGDTPEKIMNASNRSVYMKVGDPNCSGTNAVTLKTGSKSHIPPHELVYVPDVLVSVMEKGASND